MYYTKLGISPLDLDAIHAFLITRRKSRHVTWWKHVCLSAFFYTGKTLPLAPLVPFNSASYKHSKDKNCDIEVYPKQFTDRNLYVQSMGFGSVNEGERIRNCGFVKGLEIVD
jgi:hypothetical protein